MDCNELKYRVDCLKHLAMLRYGSLPLEIELGRRNGTPLDERLCKMCNHQSIENEIHVLLQCPLYDDLRANIIRNLPNTEMSVFEKFTMLLSNQELQAPLGKCVFRIMERRDIFKNVFTNLM